MKIHKLHLSSETTMDEITAHYSPIRESVQAPVREGNRWWIDTPGGWVVVDCGSTLVFEKDGAFTIKPPKQREINYANGKAK